MNKRFIWNRCKFTLKPGQRLSHYLSYRTDEGYHFEEFTLEYLSSDGETGDVICHAASGGRDCDGEIINYDDLILSPDGTWARTGGHTYDQYAQMMNY